MHAAICCTRTCSKVPTGANSCARPSTSCSNALRSGRPSTVVTTACEARIPCLRALRRDHDLPCGVLGPVDFEALRRLAAAFRWEVFMDLVIDKKDDSLKDSAGKGGQVQTIGTRPPMDALPLLIVIN